MGPGSLFPDPGIRLLQAGGLLLTLGVTTWVSGILLMFFGEEVWSLPPVFVQSLCAV